VRCKILTYCGSARSGIGQRNHLKKCTPSVSWCPACGEDIENGASTNITCERCKEVVYCSQRCLNNDFNNHVHRCPLTLPNPIVIEMQAVPTSGEGRAQMLTLLQPGGVRGQQGILIDNEEVIASVKNERWRLSRNLQKALEADEKNAAKCKEARDKVLEWYIQHNPRSSMETWRAEAVSAKAVTELLQTITGNNDFVCTREMWQAAIQVKDDLLVKIAQKRGAERGQRTWTTCIESEPEILLCFQGNPSDQQTSSTSAAEECGNRCDG